MITKLQSSDLKIVTGAFNPFQEVRNAFRTVVHEPLVHANQLVKPVVENGVVRDLGKGAKKFFGNSSRKNGCPSTGNNFGARCEL